MRWSPSIGLIAVIALCAVSPAAGRPATGESASILILSRGVRTLPATGDPVWQLRLVAPGLPSRSFEALVGRASRQNADRHRLGSQAPLPPGRYRVTEITRIRPDDPPELGRVLWIGLEPEFPTARRALGIHHDPSAGLGPESGTDGCIGLIRGPDLLALADLLVRSGTQELQVMP
jgi:hypothetical protein